MVIKVPLKLPYTPNVRSSKPHENTHVTPPKTPKNPLKLLEMPPKSPSSPLGIYVMHLSSVESQKTPLKLAENPQKQPEMPPKTPWDKKLEIRDHHNCLMGEVLVEL